MTGEPQQEQWVPPEQYPHTPDIRQLMQYQRQFIFVADDMMYGGRHHELLDSPATMRVHPACFTLNKFTLWKKDLGSHSFPVAMEESFKPSNFLRWAVEPAKVKGELYTIRPSVFWLKLDIHRQNGVQFRRKRVAIILPYRQVRYSKARPIPEVTDEYIHPVQAWMYIGRPEYWDDQLGGVFRTSEMTLHEHDKPRPWIEKFYKFDNS